MIFCVLRWTWSFVFIFVFVCIHVLCFCAAADFSVNKDLYKTALTKTHAPQAGVQGGARDVITTSSAGA